MRRRLIAALAGIAIATLALYAGPRVFMISDMVRDREEVGLERTTDQVAEALDLRQSTGLPVDGPSLAPLAARDDIELRLSLPDGAELRAGTVQRPGATTTRTLSDGTVLTAVLASETVDDRIADALVPVVVFGVIAVAFAMLVAVWLSRRLALPFARLAQHADRMALDDGATAPRAGISEADQIADALDRSRRRVAEVLRSEREFSSNASHQLRTPLSALRLRIEDLVTWPEVPDDAKVELDAALAEVDRLADTVTDLLELARSGGISGGHEMDLPVTVAAAAARWLDRFRDAGRDLLLGPGAIDVRAWGSERAVNHVLDVLFENALAHGEGTVDVTVQAVDGTGVVCVADEGSFDRTMTSAAFERRARSSSSSGSGIGLDLARTIAESSGARLRLASLTPTVFELVLPLDRSAAD